MCIHSSSNLPEWSDIHHGVCGVISKTFVYMMNVQTCITDDTANPCCMSDHYVWFKEECKNMFYW
jgi:hypothetical protein